MAQSRLQLCKCNGISIHYSPLYVWRQYASIKVCELVTNYMVIVGHRRQNLTSHAESECGIGRPDFGPHYDLLTLF